MILWITVKISRNNLTFEHHPRIGEKRGFKYQYIEQSRDIDDL